MKTAEALVYEDGSGIGKMSNEELHALKELILDHGNLLFSVKGHARDPVSGNIILLVEGGTITLDDDGIVDAHGDAKILLETAFGSLLEQNVAGNDGNKRRLEVLGNLPITVARMPWFLCPYGCSF